MSTALPSPDAGTSVPRWRLFSIIVGAGLAAAFASLVGAAIDGGQTLVWPVAGVAVFCVRQHRVAAVGVGGGMWLATIGGGADWALATANSGALLAGLLATDAWLQRRCPRPDFSRLRDTQMVLVGFALGAAVLAVASGTVALTRGTALLESANAAVAMAARYATSCIMLTVPLLFMARRRIGLRPLGLAIGVGALAALSTIMSTVGLPAGDPLVALLSFLAVPIFGWVASIHRLDALLPGLFSIAIALMGLALLVPNFHDNPSVALSFSWSVAAITGAFLMFLSGALTRAEHERRRNEQTWQQLRSAMAATNDRIWDWDVEKGAIRVETLAAEGAEDVVMGIDNWLSELHPEDLDRMEEQREALQNGESDRIDCEYRVATADLQWRWLSTRGSVIEWDSRGGVKRVIGTSRDISTERHALLERQALEKRMAQSQRLESLGVLAGGVAHDFNNLLLAMLGNLEVTIEDHGATEALVDARLAATQARDLCAQLLAYAGQRPTSLQPVDLKTMTQDIVPLLRVSTPDQVDVDIEIADGLTVLADASQFRQVILNLVLNAAEAIGEKVGRIQIRAGRGMLDDELAVKLDADPLRDAIFLDVKDDGPGMDAYVRDRLFDPFFTTKFQGRGLGMAAVLGIVRAHHGAVDVTSRKGKGTTVRLYLASTTAEVKPAVAAAAKEKTKAVGNGAQVIIADDEPAIRRTLSRALTRRGFNVVLCEDGVEALEAVSKRDAACALVIMDVVMPRLTGRDALPKIRDMAPSLKVILMSGYDIEGGEAGPFHQEPCVYLQKPFSLQALDRALSQSMQSTGGKT